MGGRESGQPACLLPQVPVSSWLGPCLHRHRSLQTPEVLKIHLGNILVPQFPRTMVEDPPRARGPWKEADALRTGAPLEVRPWARLSPGSLGFLHPADHLPLQRHLPLALYSAPPNHSPVSGNVVAPGVEGTDAESLAFSK